MLATLIYAYLIIGFFYATYILLFAGDSWYLFPINLLLWLPAFIINIYSLLTSRVRFGGINTHKSIIKGKKAVLFDLDGTVIDSEILWDHAFKKTAESLGVTLNDIDCELCGMQIAEKWKKLEQQNKTKINKSTQELVNLTNNEFLKIFKGSGIDAREGFWSLITDLKNVYNLKTGLTTNTYRNVTDVVLAQLNLKEAFDFVICGDEVKKPKPDPEIYKKAAKKLGVNSHEVLVFEDSLTGTTSAVKANMDTVVIWDGSVFKNKYPRQVIGFIPDFSALPDDLNLTIKDEFKEFVKKFNPEKPTP